jgi:hypothetical protein
LCGGFGGQPFQPDADGADFQIALHRHVGHADIAWRLHGERLFLHQSQDGIAHRGDAGAQLLGQLTYFQSGTGLQPALDQRLAQQLVDRAAQIVVFQCVQLVVHALRAGEWW